MAARVIYHDFENHKQALLPQYDPALLAIIEIIRDGLIRDSHVRLSQFGTFRLKWGKPGKGKHPMTGETITWPAQPRITFTAAKHLREQVEPNPAPIIHIENEPTDQETQTNTPESIELKKDERQQQQENRPVLKNSPDVISAANNVSAMESKPEQAIMQATEEYIPEKYQQHQEPTQDSVADEFYIEEIGPEENSEVTQKTGEKTFPTKNVILGAGMLALIPAIIMLLQAEFTQNVNIQTRSTTPQTQKIQRNISPAATTPAQTNFVTPEQVLLPEALKIESQENNALIALNDNTPTNIDTATHYLSPQVHTIEKNDNLWQLAEKYLGDAYLWPNIYRANLRTLDNPDKLTLGKQIVIPGLQNSHDDLSDNDRLLTAKSYFLLYEYFSDEKSPNAHHFLTGAKKYDAQWLKQQKLSISRKHRKYIY